MENSKIGRRPVWYDVAGRYAKQREKEIAKELCNGKTEKEIAKQLNISPNTVHFHKSSIYRKTYSRNLAELIKYAIKHRMISLEGSY